MRVEKRVVVVGFAFVVTAALRLIAGGGRELARDRASGRLFSHGFKLFFGLLLYGPFVGIAMDSFRGPLLLQSAFTSGPVASAALTALGARGVLALVAFAHPV